MKFTRNNIRRIIREELGGVVTGREKGMSISANPPAGTTGLQPGDVVYLDRDTYLDADIHPFGADFPPVTVVELAEMEQILGTTIPGQKDPPSDWDWMAGATGPAFVGSYEMAPGLGAEELVFPVSAVDWEYTKRGPKEPWEYVGDGMFAGGGQFKENKMKISKRQLRKLIREAVNEAKEPMTSDYVYKSLMGKQEFGPLEGMTRMQMVRDSLDDMNPQAAAGYVMDALWIDDPPMGADTELEDLLMDTENEDELIRIVADWGTRHFRGDW